MLFLGVVHDCNSERQERVTKSLYKPHFLKTIRIDRTSSEKSSDGYNGAGEGTRTPASPKAHWLTCHSSGPFSEDDLEASAITTPPPRRCLELLDCSF
jgi:hypothetical protein